MEKFEKIGIIIVMILVIAFPGVISEDYVGRDSRYVDGVLLVGRSASLGLFC